VSHDAHPNRDTVTAGITALRIILAVLEDRDSSLDDTLAEFAGCGDCTRDVVVLLALIAMDGWLPRGHVKLDDEERKTAEREAADMVARKIARWLDIAAKRRERGE